MCVLCCVLVLFRNEIVSGTDIEINDDKYITLQDRIENDCAFDENGINRFSFYADVCFACDCIDYFAV